MIVLKQLTPEIRIVPLTSQLAAQVRARASRALNGDGSCSLHNMNTSCFASEQCSHNASSPMDVTSLLHDEIAFVAVTVPDTNFVGCVSASRVHTGIRVRYEPEYHFSEPCSNSYMISNLCVDGAYRKRGVGKRLIDAVADRVRGHPCYLQVAKHVPDPSLPQNGDCVQAFDARVPRLFHTYDALGFTPVAESSIAHLLLRRE